MMYCIDETAQEPIMLINTHIGYDANEGQGIDGSQFQRELLYLDGLGKKRIQVWINSVGGSVSDGYNIASTILNTKTPVDTFNMGICASIAGAIFMAGRNRVMMDYAQFMMHPTSGTKDKAAKKSFEDSISSLLSAKSDISQEQVMMLMTQTTWMNALDCKDKGFATEIQSAKDVNKKRLSTANVDNFIREANLITNRILLPTKLNINQNKKSMLKVTNKLGLVEDASEESIFKAITEMEVKANEVQNSLNATITALQNQLETETAQLNADLDAQKTVNCTNLVNSFAARIGSDEAVVNKWTELAKADFEGTKTMLEALPINAVANKLPNDQPADEPTIGSYMFEKLSSIAKRQN